MKRLALFALCTVLLAPGVVLADSVQIQPSKDNSLYEDPSGSLSNGAGIYLFAGLTAQPAIRRALLQFDIAGNVPPGVTITDVSLSMRMSKTIVGPIDMVLHRVVTDWGEGTTDAPGEEGTGAPASGNDATWLHTFSPSSFWLVDGGDFDPVASASTPVGQIGNYTWAATPEFFADVESWRDDPASNYGWIMIGDETVVSAKRFDSRESVSPPVLTVTWDSPDPVPALSKSGILVALLALAFSSAIVIGRRRL
jgi:hypothetical protein